MWGGEEGEEDVCGGPLPDPAPSVWQCIKGVLRPTASQQCGGVLKEAHCDLPTTPQQRGCVRKGIHYPALPSSVAMHWRRATVPCSQQYSNVLKEAHGPLLPSKVALYRRRSTAHCSIVVWQCTEGGPVPKAYCSAKVWQCTKEDHRPLLPISMAVY